MAMCVFSKLHVFAVCASVLPFCVCLFWLLLVGVRRKPTLLQFLPFPLKLPDRSFLPQSSPRLSTTALLQRITPSNTFMLPIQNNSSSGLRTIFLTQRPSTMSYTFPENLFFPSPTSVSLRSNQTWSNTIALPGSSNTRMLQGDELSAKSLPSGLAKASRVTDGLGIYVVVTDSNFYNTRMLMLWNSWASDLDNESFFVVADEPYKGNLGVRVKTTDCLDHNHKAACCKHVWAYWYIWKELQRLHWKRYVAVFDDDTFVVLRNHPTTPTLFDHATDQVYGTTCGGVWLCGGGGAAVSRGAIMKIFARFPTWESWWKVMKKNCVQSAYLGDHAISKVWGGTRLTCIADQGRYPFVLGQDKFRKSLEAECGVYKQVQKLAPPSCQPLTYHYMKTEDQFNFLRSLFSLKAAVIEDGTYAGPCAIYKGQVACSGFAGFRAMLPKGDGKSAGIHDGDVKVREGIAILKATKTVKRHKFNFPWGHH